MPLVPFTLQVGMKLQHFWLCEGPGCLVCTGGGQQCDHAHRPQKRRGSGSRSASADTSEVHRSEELAEENAGMAFNQDGIQNMYYGFLVLTVVLGGFFIENYLGGTVKGS